MPLYPFTLDAYNGQSCTTVVLSGSLQAGFSWKLLNSVELKSKIIIELSGVTDITSIAVIGWMHQEIFAGRSVELRGVPTAIIDTFNLVPQSRKGFTLRSLILYYFCEPCELRLPLLVEANLDFFQPDIRNGLRPQCGCGGLMDEDLELDSHLQFLKPRESQGA